MKYIFLILSISMTLQMSAVSSQYTCMKLQTNNFQQKENDEPKTIRYDYLSAGSGVLGLILAFIPFLSIIGILLGVAAVILGIIAFRKKQKSRWSWIGLIAGGLTILAFLGVIGLILFF
ncbi:MAG: hypothetical protein AB8G11_07350 [Saprospiraceae bacterium]